MQNMYIDSHQHFWKKDRGDYNWLTEELGPLYRDFSPADLKAKLAYSHIDKTVVVQAAPTVAETEYLLTLATETDFIAGVVGWVDMESANVVETIERLAKNSYFKGIRPMIQAIANSEWMLKPELDAAFECLVESGLCFDALVESIHLPHLVTLLRRFPHLKTVIDHGAKPNVAEQQFDDWANSIAIVAKQTNAFCKLSGLLTEAKPGAGYEELKPYMKHLLDSFGPDRLMWGSDWPVLNLANDYSGWLVITEQFLKPLTDVERQKIMGETAKSFYQIEY